ncbi:MAG TPA: ABC transporter permease [Pyrinomonadaceae bacterium]|jgi:putative ABC transport system permease protein|nr:ABC transporter permease [Pyrinomonadaceae bacterium]
MLDKVKRRFRAVFRKAGMERELDEELRFHLDKEVERNVGRGMSPEEALRVALFKFGRVENIKEECRDARGVRPVEEMFQDLRYGARKLRKSPGFALVAVMTLALGIGANTAIFSVVNAVLLRPLPFDQPEQLVRVFGTNARRSNFSRPHSYLNFSDLRAQNQTFEAMAAYTGTTSALSGEEGPEQITGVIASGDIFRVLRTKPLMGRLLEPEDERPGGSNAVVISHGLWQRRFGGDPRVVGRTIRLDGREREVVGVTPADFRFEFVTGATDFWTPIDPSVSDYQQRGAIFLEIIGRLKPGVSVEQSNADAGVVASRLSEQYQNSNAGIGVRLAPAQEELVGDVRPTLLVLLGAVGFVLLIACANVANLLLARSAGRHREIAVRSALGAWRGRIVRQLLTESLLLAFAGGVLGLVFALWGVKLLSVFVPENVPRFGETDIDLRVLGFTLAASVVTGLLFGIAPALQSSRVDLNEALKEGGRTGTDGLGRRRVRSLLIVSEVALSLVLLVGAGLLIKSFVKLRNTDPGFDAGNTLTASLSLASVRYDADEKIADFYRLLVERVRALPGVVSVGAVTPLPLSDNNMSFSFSVIGQPPQPPGQGQSANARMVTPEYFRAQGIPLRAGRVFTDADKAGAPNVLVVNEAFARRYLPGVEPLGQRLHIGLNRIEGEIVGVVGDIRGEGLATPGEPEYYVPEATVPFGDMTLVVRTANDPASLVPALRQAVAEMDKDQPLYDVRTMDSLVARSVARQRFSMTLIGVFAVLAMLLAAVGIFSVMSFLVAQRTHEIGIRMALGARQRDILSMVVRHGVGLTLIGVGVGLAAALALTRLMSGLLYEVSATDPFIYGGITVLLAAVALAACYVPARRATKVDPLIALRYE